MLNRQKPYSLEAMIIKFIYTYRILLRIFKFNLWEVFKCTLALIKMQMWPNSILILMSRRINKTPNPFLIK